MNTNKIRTIIVEDEPNDMDAIQILLGKIPTIEIVDTAKNIEQAIAAITYHKPDLVLLDIILYGREAFEVLDIIAQYNLNPKVVFTTGHSTYQEEAMQYAAFEYLLKPIDRFKLTELVRKIEQQPSVPFGESYQKLKSTQNKIVIKSQTNFVVINPNEIVYIKADGNDSDFFLESGITTNLGKQLKYIEEQLDSTIFERIEKSHIVNLSKIINVNTKRCECQFRMEHSTKTITFGVETIRKLKKRMLEFHDNGM